MRINIEIKKKYFYILVSLTIILSCLTIAIAYNARGTGGNPSIVGHSVDEIDFSKGEDYDIWIAGGTHTTQHSDKRNLAILGTSEKAGDTLYLNYYHDGYSEYEGGTKIGGPVTIYGNLEVTGNLNAATEKGSLECQVVLKSNCDGDCYAVCPSGYVVTGGGFRLERLDYNQVITSRPMDSNKWWCKSTKGYISYCYAQCCRIV